MRSARVTIEIDNSLASRHPVCSHSVRESRFSGQAARRINVKRTSLAILIALVPVSIFAQNIGGPYYYSGNLAGINQPTPSNRLEVKGGNGAEGLTFINVNTLGIAIMAFAETGGGS